MKDHVLIATAKLRPGQDDAFSAWKARHDGVTAKFAGFISSDLIPPTNPGSNEWTLLVNFRSKEELVSWQNSPERAEVLAEGMKLWEGGNIGEIVEPGAGPESSVTEVIFSKVKAGMEERYREWTGRIQAAQAKYPGYRGMYLQPPAGKGGHWTTILRFDSSEHLEAWMNAPERRTLLDETKDFIESEELMRLKTAFPGWVPIDPVTGKGPPNWKTAMLVLLGLFPVVMLELKYLSPVLSKAGLHASLATFIGNAISVALTSFFTMPWSVRQFGWWLFVNENDAARMTRKGVLILLALYAVEIGALWRLLPW